MYIYKKIEIINLSYYYNDNIMSPTPRKSVQHLSHSMETTFDDTISDFFKCMSIPDQANKLGRTYVYFYNSLTRLINMSPEEITQIYINYIKSLNEDNSIDISKRVFIYNDKSPSDEKYVMKFLDGLSDNEDLSRYIL